MLPNSQSPSDLITFTEEILNEEFHFLCNVGVKHNSRVKSSSAWVVAVALYVMCTCVC